MKSKKAIVLLSAIIVFSCALRAPITGVGSLIGYISDDLSLSNMSAGMLTTIPLMAFSAVSFFIGSFSHRLGAGKVLLTGIILLFVGIILRSFANISGLFVGTAVIGLGIAVGNVLIPAVIKAFFPARIGILTSAYTTTMSVFAGISGGISIPIAKAFGWQFALLVWIILAFAALILWLPNKNLQLTNDLGIYENAEGRRPITKDSMTWCVALYMGIQSLLFYCLVAWFATILQSKGFDTSTAGYFNSIYMLLGIPGSLIIPLLASKSRNQSFIGLGLGVIYVTGLSAMLFSDNMAALIIALICCGFCSGATISFSMILFGLHTANPADTSALSGLSQSIGYLLAAVGPTVTGKIYDQIGSWSAPITVLLIFAVMLTVLGYMAGKEKIING